MADVPIQQAFDQVLRLRDAGRRAEADALYRHILDQIPNEPNALHTLGVLAHRQGQNEFAVDLLSRAVALAPDDAEFHENLGTVLIALNRWDEAAKELDRAAELDPTPNVCLAAAHALRQTDQSARAMRRYRQAISLQHDLPAAHNNLGNLLREGGELAEAIASYRRAIELRPDYVEGHNNLAGALLDSGDPEEAVAHYNRTIELRPDSPEFHNNLGKALRAVGDVPGAIAAHERALSLRPNDPEAHWNLSIVRLLSGDWERGWNDYEYRWAVPEFRSPRRSFRQPQWIGQPLKGKRILLHAEQGFGDTIQFCRYAPLVAQQGARVTLEVPPELHRPLRTLPGVEQLVATGEALPEFDYHSPLLSLPRIFLARPDSVPNYVPYLQAEATLTERWKSRLELKPDKLRVGIAWSGSPGNPNDRYRSVPFAALAPLLGVNDVRFYSLQTGPAAEQALANAKAFPSLAFPDGFEDFADTAGLIANLDMVITVDTSIAHLAGALAVPVWTMLPLVPDWRWLLDRQDTPWYPTMRLFRQPRRGDWDSVIRLVAEELQRVTAEALREFPVA